MVNPPYRVLSYRSVGAGVPDGPPNHAEGFLSRPPLHTVTRNLPRYLCGAMWASPPTKFYRHSVRRGGVLPRPSTSAAGTISRCRGGRPCPPLAPSVERKRDLGENLSLLFIPLCVNAQQVRECFGGYDKIILAAKHTKTVGDCCRIFLQMAGM